MLIIAIPKTASTSLLTTLGKLHNTGHTQLMFPGLTPTENFKAVGKYHSDIRNHPPGLLQTFCESPIFFKQHIPPTDSHLRSLKLQKKVVLSRPSHEIVDAYYRAEQRGIHRPKKEFNGASTIIDWRERAKEIGLTDDLSQFSRGWKNNLDGNTLLIEIHHLMTNPGDAIREIEQFFDLPTSTGDIILCKERYSREGDG